jgi:hypothetical protein
MAAQDRQTQPLKALAAHQRPSTSWEQATPRDPRLSTPVIKRLSDRRLRNTVHVHPSARGTWQVRATRAGRTYIKRVQRTRWTTAVTLRAHGTRKLTVAFDGRPGWKDDRFRPRLLRAR